MLFLMFWLCLMFWCPMLEILNALKSHPFLANLCERDRMVWAARAQPFHDHQDDLLYHQDDLLVLASELADGGEDEVVPIQRLGTGAVLGWSWLPAPNRSFLPCTGRSARYQIQWLLAEITMRK
jgi:hypothetical protein